MGGATWEGKEVAAVERKGGMEWDRMQRNGIKQASKQYRWDWGRGKSWEQGRAGS